MEALIQAAGAEDVQDPVKVIRNLRKRYPEWGKYISMAGRSYNGYALVNPRAALP